MSGAALSTGIEEHDTDGVHVQITSPARTVVDCFKFELWRQADRLRMSKVIRPYWDAMSS